MALAAHEVSLTKGENHALAVEKKVVVDEESGIAAQVENVAVAVKLDDGTIGVVTQKRITGVQANTQNNSTVVHYQLPTQVTLHDVNIDINSSPDSEYVYASGSRRFAMSLTYMCAGILFLWSIPFAVIAWILAIAASAAWDNANFTCAKGLKMCSLFWSITSLLSGLGIPAAVGVGVYYGYFARMN